MKQQSKNHGKTYGAMHRGNVQSVSPAAWPEDPKQPQRAPLKEPKTARFYMGIMLVVIWFVYIYMVYSLYGK